MQEYDRICEWFVSTRSAEAGVPDVAAFVRSLPAGARVLELGCGAGMPLSSTLLQHGCVLSAVDSSPAMVARFRERFPGVTVQCARIQDVDVAAGAYEGVLAWGVLFHLSAEDQARAIALAAHALAPGGKLLFTSGDVEGVAESDMDGVLFRYVSLGAATYEALLALHGLRLIESHADAWDNYVYVAQKLRPSV